MRKRHLIAGSSLLAITLIACPIGTEIRNSNTISSLSIAALASGTTSITVFVSNADGSLIDAKTVNPGEGEKTFVFKDVPNDALVTGAYNSGAIRLHSYPATYANQHGFYPITINDQRIGFFDVSLEQPSSGYSLGYATRFPLSYGDSSFGINGIAKLGGILTQNQIQTDGKYSPVFIALDVEANPWAYAVRLDQTPPKYLQSVALSVQSGDWKNLEYASAKISNVESYKITEKTQYSSDYCPDLHGKHKGVSIDGVNSCNSGTGGYYDLVTNTLNYSLKYIPNYYDSYNLSLRLNSSDDLAAGKPAKVAQIEFNNLKTIPATLNLDARTDLLQAPTALSILNPTSLQPTVTWTSSSNLKPSTPSLTNGTTLEIMGNNYNWFFDQLPATQNSLVVPQVPTNLGAAFAPADTSTNPHRYAAGHFEKSPDVSRSAQSLLTPSAPETPKSKLMTKNKNALPNPRAAKDLFELR